MHTRFKCLDVAKGRAYISRDVIFYESDYPFAQLHPNDGASLRSEILLLPPTLLNPSSGFWDNNSSDLFANGSLRTNPFVEHARSAKCWRILIPI
jgi:hypothetical protein